MTFRVAWVAAAAVLSVAIGPAGGDTGPYHALDIRVRFEGLADHPDYDFYLKYGLGRGNPYVSMHLTRVEPGAETRLEGEGNRLTEVYLLAVPRGQSMPPAPPVGTDRGREWLTETPPGALRSDPLPGETAGSHLSAGHNKSLVSYRVRVDRDRLRVDWAGEQAVAGDSSAGATWWWAVPAGLGACAVLAVGGVVWMSRARRAARR